jgi:signal transduction histidine kinase/CheY-like chemotaxis protein
MAIADRAFSGPFKRFIFNRMITKRLVLPVQGCACGRETSEVARPVSSGRYRGSGEPMRVWRKHPGGLTGRGVARAAAAGVTGHELAKEAVAFLVANTVVDRIGVWIEWNDVTANDARGLRSFRGMVADGNGETTPAEWERLSPEAPLPPELLASGKTVEQDLGGTPYPPILGVLVGMERALWVPVEAQGRLRGVLFAGVRNKHGAFPRGPLEAVAAELALALELEDERQLVREREGDLAVTKGLLATLGSSGPADAILTSLVASCTEMRAERGGLGAVFAVLRRHEARPNGEIARGAEESLGSGTQHSSMPEQSLTDPPGPLSWQSGDAAWTRALEREPLAGLLQRAREAHCPIVSEPGVSLPRGDVARVVAIPLEAAGQTLGVLAAGFRQGASSAASLERLELRAAVATAGLLVRTCREQTQRSAEQQQALFQAGSGATILLDAEGGITGLSRGAQELLGEAISSGGGELESDRGRVLRFSKLFAEREQPCVEDWLKRSRNVGPASGLDEELPEEELRSGVRVRLRSVALPGGGLGVSLEPAVAADREIGDRAEARLANVIEWLEEGVVLFDADHGIRAMNTRFAQIAGLAPEEASRITTLGGLIARLASQAAQPDQFAERWREQARGGDAAVREEIQFLRPVPRVLERAARPITDGAGRRLGRVEIYRDLTAQRVFQSKLLQTEKLAALGQMMTGVAHELSNPLTSILGYAQRLFLRNDDAGQLEEVRQIFQEAERASTILRQLLMTARDSRPERRKVSLNQVVLRTMELQRFSLAAERVRVETDLDPALPFVLGDAGQLQQVLMNLVGNSRQAIEQRGRGGSIRLSTKRIGESRALLEVSDDGPGIPDAIISRIFDPFFTTKPAGIGTGLGLAIVLGIVREHGGQVNVACPPRGGAIFSLEFAAVRGPEPRSPMPFTTAAGGRRRERLPVRQASEPTPEPAARVSSLTGTRVLIVEDEPTVARLIGDVLEDEGLLVDALLDGREALERATHEAYDLVICDMKMPGLDGQDFYNRLVSTGSPLGKKFLFVTGDVMGAQTHEFLERNQLPHVAKPFRVEELTEKVRRVLADTAANTGSDVGPRDPSPGPAARTNAARK